MNDTLTAETLTIFFKQPIVKVTCPLINRRQTNAAKKSLYKAQPAWTAQASLVDTFFRCTNLTLFFFFFQSVPLGAQDDGNSTTTGPLVSG